MVFSIAIIPIMVGSCLMFSKTSSKVAQHINCVCSPSKYRFAAMSWNDPLNPCIAILFILLLFVLNRKSRLIVVKRDLTIYHLYDVCLVISWNLHATSRFAIPCKVEKKVVKVCVKLLHYRICFIYLLFGIPYPISLYHLSGMPISYVRCLYVFRLIFLYRLIDMFILFIWLQK